MRKTWRALAFILPLVAASPVYSGAPPAPPDFTAIQQQSQIAYKVVNLESGKSVEKPAPELHCPPMRSQLRRVRDEHGVVSLKAWEPDAKAAPFFAEAEKALAAGRLQEAADAYAKGLTLSPEYGPGWGYAGDVQFARKDYAGALGFYRKALALDPSLAQAHHFAADSLFKLGRLSEAENEYVQALIYEPSYEEVWKVLQIVGPRAGFMAHRPAISTPAGAIGENVEGKVEIGVANREWLPYLNCKAVWRHEDAYRKARLAAAPQRYSRSLTLAGTTYTWSVVEEAECLRSYVAGNLSTTAARLEEQGAGSGQEAGVSREKVLAAAPELVRTLVQVEDADLLDGFILFALFGQRCPMAVALFSDAERGQMERFIRKLVIVHGEAVSSPTQAQPSQASPQAVSSGEPRPPSINPPFSGYERTVMLAPDLSGTARVINILNMETLVGVAAENQSAAEGAAMREKWATQLKNSEKALPRWRASIEKGLPQGVKLVGAWQKTEGLKSTTTFAFSFDNVAKLARIDLRSPGDKAAAKDRPFAELSFTVQGDALLVTSQPAEPPRGKNAMEIVAYRLETPLEVLEANATRREGSTLIWEFDPYQIQTTGKVPAEVRVRFKTNR
ncbi:MAG TPA: tetratricopeptide repeat protein [Thermoanaerobaculia bacterium]|nr:tetratricopeptide repeat protein [Thermoanaerobaculia bacterium]